MSNKYTVMLLVSLVVGSYSELSLASHSVNGYTRRDGTYVQPHMSMDPGESQSTGMSYHNNQLVPRENSNNYSGNSFDSNEF